MARTAAHRALLDGQLETLYSDHHRWLESWLRGRLGNQMDAEDVAQDTFLRVIRSSLDGEHLREPRRYLITIARGLTVDLFRRRTLERQYLEALAVMPETTRPSEEDQAIILETLLEIDAMLDGLGSQVKQTFILSRFDGLTYQQIGDQLGVSLRTVNNHMARAMEHCCLYLLGLRS
ncbi:MAG: sigma-70 family RNA polymerase sigma factor [Porticoccaceae bacterium]